MKTVFELLAESDARKANGPWVPANCGTETPYYTRTKHRVLYCYQPSTGKHAYLDMGTDMIIPDAELHLFGIG